MNREELKDLVKECIIEVLSDGLATTLRESAAPRPQRQQGVRNPQELALAAKRSALDGIRVGSSKSSKAPPLNPQPKPNVSRIVEGLTNDPVMSSIFADTANNTLIEQVEAESGRGSRGPTTGVDPSMFEGSANWAALAFAEKRSSR